MKMEQLLMRVVVHGLVVAELPLMLPIAFVEHWREAFHKGRCQTRRRKRRIGEWLTQPQ
jgi:hypothetical protein